MRFNPIQRHDIGDYQCTARNEYGSDVGSVRVNVLQPEPSVPVVIEPSNFNGRPGDAIILHCRNVINVYATLVWTKEGFTQLPAYVHDRNGVLTIHRGAVEDTGRYICTSSPASPNEPSLTNTIEVVIHGDDGGHDNRPAVPVIKPIQELYTVLQGSDFSLPCEATGHPHPTVVWQKIHESSLGQNIQQTGHILRIVNANLDNRGIYQCTATSGDSTSEVNTIIEIERKCSRVREGFL